MKRYEYKFMKAKLKIGLNYEKKVDEMEAEWNKLGAEGWRFCTWANDVMVFIRETED